MSVFNPCFIRGQSAFLVITVYVAVGIGDSLFNGTGRSFFAGHFPFSNFPFSFSSFFVFFVSFVVHCLSAEILAFGRKGPDCRLTAVYYKEATDT